MDTDRPLKHCLGGKLVACLISFSTYSGMTIQLLGCSTAIIMFNYLSNTPLVPEQLPHAERLLNVDDIARARLISEIDL